MTHRDNIRSALLHREGEAVPIDFGSTAVTGIHVSCVAALRDHFGLARHPVKVHEPYQMLGWLDEDLLEAMGIATTGVPPPRTMFGFPNTGWKEYRLPWNQVVLLPSGFVVREDHQGDLLVFPEGDPNAPPSGRMPVGGFFFDAIVRQPPLVEDRLDPAENTEEFSLISDEDLEYFHTAVEAQSSSSRAVVATFGGTAFGDIALVPAPFLKHPRGIRDIAEWYIATATRRDYIHAVFERQTEIALANLARIHEVVGNALECVFVCGTDFGTQTSSFCSPATFDELYAPYYRRVNQWIHSHTTWKTMKHSCGAVEPFISHFIECGFDVLNPVQCSATGMDPGTLKDRYGEKIVFWGGGVDTQRTLPFGTPDQVREEVLDRCKIFAPGGGFVFNAIHNIQAGTPVANIVAMLDGVRVYNGHRAKH